jgi:hypothetical protein
MGNLHEKGTKDDQSKVSQMPSDFIKVQHTGLIKE